MSTASKGKTLIETTDLAFASFLKLRGLSLKNFYNKGTQVVFVFDDPESQEKTLAIAYLNSSERSFHQELRALKKLTSI